MSETSSGTWQADPVAGFGVAVLDGAVYGDTLDRGSATRRVRINQQTHSAKDGGSFCAIDGIGDGGDVSYPRLDVLLEGAVDGEAGVTTVVANYNL